MSAGEERNPDQSLIRDVARSRVLRRIATPSDAIVSSRPRIDHGRNTSPYGALRAFGLVIEAALALYGASQLDGPSHFDGDETSHVYLLLVVSVGAMGRARIGEEQHLDGNGSTRTCLRIADAPDERLDESFHLIVQRPQLVDGNVEQEFAGASRLLPLRRGVAAQREAFLQTVEVERVQDARQCGCGKACFGIIADVREAQTGVDQAPRPAAPGDSLNLFDESVLGELTKME
jgi:hypothetical protein